MESETAEKAISHFFGIGENHIEEVDDYLIRVHTFYLTNEDDLAPSHRRECDYYFQQLRTLLKSLKQMERKLNLK